MNDDPAFADMDRHIAGLEDASGIAQTILDAQEHARAEAARTATNLQPLQRAVEALEAAREPTWPWTRDVGQSGSVSRVDPSGVVGGGDPSGAVAELPDAAIEAAAGPVSVGAVRDAAAAMVRWCDDPTASPTVLGSILVPLVPAVRAEAVVERDAHWQERLNDVRAEMDRAVRHETRLRGMLLREFWRAVHDTRTAPDHWLISEDQLICAVQDMHREGQCSEAEAVADERRRIVGQIERYRDITSMVGTAAYHVGDLAEIVAAGSVPVVTPEPLPGCAYCVAHGSDHRRVGSKPFAVWVGRERDSDGAPDTLHVSYAAGHHLGEGEAEFVRRALRSVRPVATPTEPDIACRHGRVGGCGLDGINESASPTPEQSSRAELAVLRAALRKSRCREREAADAAVAAIRLMNQAGAERDALQQRIDGADSPSRPGHLAVIQASLPPGLTEVAGGTETQCRAQLEDWVAEHGLRDGERALLVAVVAETVVEPGVGVYTTPGDQP